MEFQSKVEFQNDGGVLDCHQGTELFQPQVVLCHHVLFQSTELFQKGGGVVSFQ